MEGSWVLPGYLSNRLRLPAGGEIPYILRERKFQELVYVSKSVVAPVFS